jgi:hypothetical protein
MPILPHHSPFPCCPYPLFPLAHSPIPHPLVTSCSLGDRVLEGIGTGVEQEGSRKGRVLPSVYSLRVRLPAEDEDEVTGTGTGI